jgi:hypothetical protein
MLEEVRIELVAGSFEYAAGAIGALEGLREVCSEGLVQGLLGAQVYTQIGVIPISQHFSIPAHSLETYHAHRPKIRGYGS